MGGKQIRKVSLVFHKTKNRRQYLFYSINQKKDLRVLHKTTIVEICSIYKISLIFATPMRMRIVTTD
jgi:hypothetical protein